MKEKIKYFKILTLLFILNGCSVKTVPLKWESEPVFDKPECVLYYQDSILFVSNINGSPSKKDSNGFISTIKLNGEIIEKYWVKGLDAPKGMYINDNKLYVTDIDRVLVIDIPSKKVIDKILIENSRFLNDIVIDEKNNIYISDTKNSCVYVLNDFGQKKLSGTYKGANGLSITNENLYIGTRNDIFKYEIETNQQEKIIENIGNVDGIHVFNDAKIIKSNYFNKLTIIEDGKIKTLLKGMIFRDCIADFQYLDNGLLILPTFDKTIRAYKLNE
jgi:hypothetical protein